MRGKLCLFILAFCSLTMNVKADQYIPLDDSTSTANVDTINRSMNSLFTTKMDLRPQDVIPVKPNAYSLGNTNYPWANVVAASATITNINSVFKTAAGSFTAPSANGNQSVTGVGFRPRLVRLFVVYVEGASTFSFGQGRMTSSAQSTEGFYIDGNPPTAAWSVINACLKTGSLGNETVATYVSMDSDGFTISWSFSGSGYGKGAVIHYEAIQ